MIDFTKGPILMGIVNTTPDSFSDGGLYNDAENAIAHAKQLIREGADIIDIGGESTRPGAASVSIDEELTRVIPVIKGLQGCGALISIDTRHARVMEAALQAGAGMINDISALAGDPDSLAVAAASDVPVCLMHMQGIPRDMQNKPSYNNVIDDVFGYLLERIDVCEKAGIAKGRLIADVGIGFGKTLEHNISLLRGVSHMHKLGLPILLGASRKSFIAKICDDFDPVPSADHRVSGSVSTALWGLQQGVQIFRVHDVAATKQAFAVYRAIAE